MKMKGFKINVPTRPNCTRLKICPICPFKDSDFNKDDSLQSSYHRDSMKEIYIENEGVWTCLFHLNHNHSINPQCHIGAKELIKVGDYYNNLKQRKLT